MLLGSTDWTHAVVSFLQYVTLQATWEYQTAGRNNKAGPSAAAQIRWAGQVSTLAPCILCTVSRSVRKISKHDVLSTRSALGTLPNALLRHSRWLSDTQCVAALAFAVPVIKAPVLAWMVLLGCSSACNALFRPASAPQLNLMLRTVIHLRQSI